jgi:hypothetical protein
MIIYIFTNKTGYYLSNVLKYILKKEKHIVYITEQIELKNENLYIILFSHKVKIFPKNYIIYNLEQKDISPWIDKKYELSMIHSKKSWDYSHVNISKFNSIIQKKLSYFQLPCIDYNLILELNNLYPSNNITKFSLLNNLHMQEFDILFYGVMNHKRKKILNQIENNLDKKFKMQIISNIYGYYLFEFIKKAKIILNISYYENALLECYRINEVQSCKKLVISFYPNKQDIINYEYYKNSVVFVKTVPEMINSIFFYLNNPDEYNKKINNIKFIENTNFINDLL